MQNAECSVTNFKGSIDDWFKQFGFERNVVVSAPCFSIVPMYLKTTDSFDVIAAWHARYNEDALQKWVVSLLEIES
ncbi:hypothetical protein [uncultured Psychromonas sp.]|uniref:hypothetical protein n=1 Tax=uncultured Psychromonas sp. TaxID=173974 RepID=UPI00262CECD1|nr:hypothetical protein [uncultured Psychromonas sp.]